MANTMKQKRRPPLSSKPTTSMASRSKTKILITATIFLCFTVPLCTVLLLSSSSKSIATVYQSPNNINLIQIVNEFPHDPDAFTQGLLYAGNDVLYESTGLYGRSSVRRVALQTGKVELIQMMDSSVFGEGLTLFGERLFQVTWLKKSGFIYNRKDLRKVGEFNHEMQDGWGLTTDGTVLYGSDGTSTLYQLDPQMFKVIRKHVVKYNGYEVRLLNELEHINGEVWANVWQTDCIARISPKDGAVLGWILLHDLRKKLLAAGHNGIDSSNGIAWDGSKNRLFVTGKLWPKLYEVNLHPVKEHVKHEDIEKLCIP